MIDTVSYLNNGLSTKPTDSKASSSLDKDAFMQLLVAQMGNQNPLEPMDNTQFLSQLAQFSALEQQQNIAKGIELLALTQTASTNSQMVNLIGKRVIAEGNKVSLSDGKAVELRFEFKNPPPASDIIISDSKGNIVRTIQADQLKAGLNQIEFDGKDSQGNVLADGNYTYTIKARTGAKLEGVTQYANYLVDAVKFDGSSILLKSQDLTIDLADISEVIQN